MTTANQLASLGNGPAFLATSSVAQSVTQNTTVKVNFTSESFDTNNCYDASNSRFTPTIAGYYFITVSIWFETYNSAPLEAQIFKNGSGGYGGNSSYTGGTSAHNQQVSNVVYCNGTTDYIEGYTYVAGSITGVLGTGGYRQWFAGCLLRAA